MTKISKARFFKLMDFKLIQDNNVLAIYESRDRKRRLAISRHSTLCYVEVRHYYLGNSSVEVTRLPNLDYAPVITKLRKLDYAPAINYHRKRMLTLLLDDIR